MALAFRDPNGFFKETAAVTGTAAVAGAAAGAAGLFGAPLVAAVGGAALVGGAIAAAVTRETPATITAFAGKPTFRAILGVIGGGIAALGFSALSWKLGLGLGGTFAAGALGGLSLGMLLSGDGVKDKRSQAAGLAGATGVGAIGALALQNAASFAISEGTPMVLTASALAGLMGLWIAAGAGLRRLEPQDEPLVARASALLTAIAEPLRSKVQEGLTTWAESTAALASNGEIGEGDAQETRRLANHLFAQLLETAEQWHSVRGELGGPRTRGVDDKLKDLEQRLATTDDDVTKAHLGRALAALKAQKAAVDDLQRSLGRAEAVVDVQLALLERLGLAVSQHRVSERERFSVEINAVGEEASRVATDVDALSQAIAAADQASDSLSDRRALADLESSARRAFGKDPIAADAESPSSAAAPVRLELHR